METFGPPSFYNFPQIERALNLLFIPGFIFVQIHRYLGRTIR